MYNKDNPNYKLYLAGIITENQYYEAIDDAHSTQNVIDAFLESDIGKKSEKPTPPTCPTGNSPAAHMP